MSGSPFNATLKHYVACAEAALERHAPPATVRPASLHEAMRYSLEAGGKRLRPVLVLATADLFGALERAGAAAAAVEMVHTYSLIHDDLPCMDDSDLRRGRPSCHRRYGEALALLAGDALLAEAFAVLATAYAAEGPLGLALVRDLAVAAGGRHLVGGQVEDLAASSGEGDGARLEFIEANKTGALLVASVTMGARLGGAGPEALACVQRYGEALGVAFQVVDDILDATSDAATLGKPVGHDVRNDTLTYVGLYGMEAARARAQALTAEAVAACADLPLGGGFLVDLAHWLEGRLC